MSSMLRKLFPDMWTSADTYLRKLSPNVCGYLSGISSMLRKLFPTCGYLPARNSKLRKLFPDSGYLMSKWAMLSKLCSGM